MKVIELDNSLIANWDSFVENNPYALFSHLSGWKDVICETYGHEAKYFLAIRNGIVEGVMPLFIIRNKVFGDSITSLPGGICSNNQEATNALLGISIDLVKETNAKFSVFRDTTQNQNLGLTPVTTYHRLVMKLPDNSNMLWNKISPKSRNKIRQARKVDFKIEYDNNNLHDFYKVIAINYRRLGTPVFPIQFLENIFLKFKKNVSLVCARFKGEIVGGVFLFGFRDTIYNPWSSSNPLFFHLRPNNILYFEAIKFSCERKYKYFNFGRSRPNSGTYVFKKQWGAVGIPLVDFYYLNTVNYIPEPYLLMERLPAYRLLPKIWSFMPLAMTNCIGPKLASLVPLSI